MLASYRSAELLVLANRYPHVEMALRPTWLEWLRWLVTGMHWIN